MSRIAVIGAAWLFALVVEQCFAKAQLALNVGVVETGQLENLKSAPPPGFDNSKTYIIQLDGPLTTERRVALHGAGIELGEYLPDASYVADLRNAAPAVVAALPFLTWVGEFRPQWKLDPGLGKRPWITPQRQALNANGDSAIVVTLFEHHGAAKVLDILGRLAGASVHFVQDEGGTLVLSATVRSADIPALAALGDVHYVEDAPEITLRNAITRWVVQSNVTNSTPIWDHGIIGIGQILGHMDDAININHCAFFDPVNNTPGSSHRKIVAYNEPPGSQLHGTHTADTAAGEDFNGSTGNLRGMAYGAKIAHSPIPNFSDTGFYDAAVTLYGQGARAFTNSYGDDNTTNYNSLCRGIDRFSYDNEDAFIAFAVTNTPTLKNPENAKNLLAIGASMQAPNQATWCYGGTGPTADGRRKPEIAAPGCSIDSANYSTACSTISENGTSMATPAVTAVGLLVREYYMRGFYPSGAATPANAFTPSGALIKATLLNSAVDLTGVSGFPSDQEGWGRLLIDNALQFSCDVRKLVVLADIRNANGMSTGQQQQYIVTVSSSSQPLKVTLVWTDPPASASTGTASAATNDLDLEVVAPNSTLYRGNVFSGGLSATGGSKDPNNNVEMVLLSAPSTGVWTIRVKAAAINSGTQGFALLATGALGSAPTSPAPILASCNPNAGATGRTLSPVGISGANFQTSGTTIVKLARTGQTEISASNVSVSNASNLSCNITLAGAVGGPWDLVVVNPDGQCGSIAGGFFVCIRGDVNADGVVDGKDIQRFVTVLVNGNAIPAERCAGDLGGNGVVDISDVSSFVSCVLAGGCP